MRDGPFVPLQTLAAPVAKTTRRLLIVQQNAFVARSLSRYLQRLFEAVHVASSEAEAECILRDPQRTPTDLVCGQFLGTGNRSGLELIPSWRSEFPTLRRVVLATGADNVPVRPPGVDAVHLKPGTPSELALLLA